MSAAVFGSAYIGLTIRAIFKTLNKTTVWFYGKRTGAAILVTFGNSISLVPIAIYTFVLALPPLLLDNDWIDSGAEFLSAALILSYNNPWGFFNVDSKGEDTVFNAHSHVLIAVVTIWIIFRLLNLIALLGLLLHRYLTRP